MATSVSLANPTVSSPFLVQKRLIQRKNSNSWLSFPLKFSRGLALRTPMCAYDTPYEGSNTVFPRIRVWDPYKRLGIDRDASEEEVWSCRNMLLNQYAGHETSFESIEAAFEKILMASFRHRKKTKINLKSQLKKKVEESPPWVQNLLNFVELPPGVIIMRRFFLFGFMACWSVMNSAQAGPAFQVAISLAACIYFLNDKMKSVPRAAITGFLALVVGWIGGSLFVPLIPTSLLPATFTLELLTSMVVYVFLFLACTFLK
ncbi:OLC1v1014044C2 [Oldenlandia corymbosa var. corymbosa]|uniref:OLC1v1014044C2 n=1 Tax=Oldenlandia corymbosa var. corymbosa TaxID=529605 RepID=A0AAV1E049_OLDCO|nr:OLC1v1014044C2 [Oldenlandia corymbosa var. corymbosa]